MQTMVGALNTYSAYIFYSIMAISDMPTHAFLMTLWRMNVIATMCCQSILIIRTKVQSGWKKSAFN